MAGRDNHRVIDCPRPLCRHPGRSITRAGGRLQGGDGPRPRGSVTSDHARPSGFTPLISQAWKGKTLVPGHRQCDLGFDQGCLSRSLWQGAQHGPDTGRCPVSPQRAPLLLWDQVTWEKRGQQGALWVGGPEAPPLSASVSPFVAIIDPLLKLPGDRLYKRGALGLGSCTHVLDGLVHAGGTGAGVLFTGCIYLPSKVV